MAEAELRAWLRLSRLELSPKASRALVKHFDSPEAVFEASEDQLKQVGELTERGLEKLKGPAPAAIDRDLKLIEELGVTIVPVTSPDYPPLLLEIYDPPALLYVRGELLEKDRLGIGIVGSRRASHYGRLVAEKISYDLAAAGLTVISGGARGVDTAAHKGALDAGGRTIAVLGCGLDVIYPAENKKLFQSIAETGAVVSEFPLGSTPEPWRFPPRNRLISGIGLGVLICQSPETSGALITAGYALEQGRDVFAVPGNVDDVRNRGSHKLIKEGARLVESAQDIFEELGIVREESDSVGQVRIPLPLLNEEESKIVALLSLDPTPVDEIIDKTGLPAPVVSGTLTILEMKGVVRRLPGNAYVRQP